MCARMDADADGRGCNASRSRAAQACRTAGRGGRRGRRAGARHGDFGSRRERRRGVRRHRPRWAKPLEELGCTFALDDFGTGFSSFAYLQSLPVDLVKIDGSFVADIDTNPTNRALVQAMVAVSHALGGSVVADKVERASVAEVLVELGVEYGQGWSWSKPIDPSAAQ